MKIAIISGSHRRNSRSAQAAKWIEANLRALDCAADTFDLCEMDLPFWSEDFWNQESASSAQWKPYSERLNKCDGIVLISPEWAGMIPPKLGNFLLLCSHQELAYKPALIVAVSAGPSGTYPIAQLRMSAAKNNQMVFLPDHLIMRNAASFLAPASEPAQGSCLDEGSHLNVRLRHNLRILAAMAEDLRRLRDSIDLKLFPYGM